MLELGEFVIPAGVAVEPNPRVYSELNKRRRMFALELTVLFSHWGRKEGREKEEEFFVVCIEIYEHTRRGH